MRNRDTLLGSLMLIWMLNGCAATATSRFEYTPPDQIEVQNEVVSEKNFEVVWDRLVKELAKSFYVINNIEKESRIINLSFATDHPEEFVDCGTSHRTFKHGRTEETYDYPVAGSSAYRIAGGRAGDFANFQVISSVQRRSSLEGRANIYVAPEGAGARVAVNCRYVLTVETSGTTDAINYYGGVVARQPLHANFSATFNTNQLVTTDWAGVAVQCRSSGKLEGDILEMVPR